MSERGVHRLYVGSHDGVCSLTSDDGGQTWKAGPKTDLSHAASRLCASLSDPAVAYLAAYESGVFRTEDGGISWSPLTSYPSDYAHSVLVHPADPQTVYVGSEPAAIFASQDGGATWEENPGFAAVPESAQWSFHSETRESHIRDLRMSPQTPDIIFAGVEIGGIVRSQDGGKSWVQRPGLNDDVHCIGLSQTGPNRIYVATARGPYRSDDEGDHWEFINEGVDRRYALHISVAPHNADMVLLTVSENSRRANPQLLRTINGGRKWQVIADIGHGGDMVVSMDWDRSLPNRVYAGTDHGRVYYSDDDGEHWAQIPVELGTIAVGATIAA